MRQNYSFVLSIDDGIFHTISKEGTWVALMIPNLSVPCFLLALKGSQYFPHKPRSEEIMC